MKYPRYQPAWLTDELNQALGKITGSNASKKRATVLRLAEGAATGRTQQDTFKLPDTCTWKTWDGHYRGGKKKPGWRHDPDVQAALEIATRRALWYQDQADARRIAERQENVARARDKLAELSWPAALKLGNLLGAENLETARRAANDILDRADEGTATKTVSTESGDHEQRIKLDLADLPADILQVLAGLGPEGDAGQGGAGGTE